MITKKVALVALILTTMTSLLLYNNIQSQPYWAFRDLSADFETDSALTTMTSLLLYSNIQSQPYRVFRDLSSDFETDYAYVANHLSVLEALKRDGYTPVAVSEVLVYRSTRAPPAESAISCFTTSHPVNEVTNATHNLSDVVSNKSIDTNSTNIQCLQVNGQMNSTKTFRVPNVVHYVFLGSDLTFTFANYMYLSYRSVERFIKPNQIFVHGDHTPDGEWWNRTIDEVKNIYHVKRTYTRKAPNGQPYKYLAHISDYMRTETLLNYGGIYLDADVLVVKSFTTLRQFSFVIGREHAHGLCNGIMLADRGAPFLRLLLEQYHSYSGSKETWGDKSVANTDKLARLYPHLVHIEETTLNRPGYYDRAQIYNGSYNWAENYAIHLWIRAWPGKNRPIGVEDILTKNTTFGEIARLAIFGSQEIRKNATKLTSRWV